MHTFLGLPNEILLEIVKTLEFKDIESVTLSCKHIRELAPEILDRHLSRKRRFTTVAVGQIPVCNWSDAFQSRPQFGAMRIYQERGKGLSPCCASYNCSTSRPFANSEMLLESDLG